MHVHNYSVSSSEKVDKWARYADFQIASMPYPGEGKHAMPHLVYLHIMQKTYIPKLLFKCKTRLYTSLPAFNLYSDLYCVVL